MKSSLAFLSYRYIFKKKPSRGNSINHVWTFQIFVSSFIILFFKSLLVYMVNKGIFVKKKWFLNLKHCFWERTNNLFCLLTGSQTRTYPLAVCPRSPGCPLLQLPDPVLLHLLSLLPSRTLARTAATCR